MAMTMAAAAAATHEDVTAVDDDDGFYSSSSWLTRLPYPTVHSHMCQYLDVWSLVALR